jgi:hypothetical protein
MMFMQNNLVTCAKLPDADLYNSDPATDVYNMKNYDRITFILVEGAGGTGTAVLTVEECTSAAAAGATAIAYRYKTCADAGSADTWSAWTAIASTGYTTVAGANKMVAIEVRSNELSAGYPFIRLQLTEDANDPVDACVMAILSDPRDSQDVMPTAIV